MTSERWQHIDRLFHSALERPREERAGFLAEACAGDESVRSEVEALIVAHERSGEFLDAPAYEGATAQLANDLAMLPVGDSVGHYKILGSLGVGGMGEVYLAQDTRLARKIALKLLPHEFTKDADRVRRFEQEARAASTLSHPNVSVIYEIGETEDGRRFIAMEYIEGMTLRQRLAKKHLKLVEALEVATQIAGGLTAAHAANIVHRDIKPENIMLRNDGLVKLLDFGLAKLTERPTIETDTESLTRALVQTGSGMIMGTVAYMSPEQARGLPVDARTDIWSLGVVLYEMVASAPPFAGPTPSDMIVSILDREPLPLSFHKKEIPAELERIVRKSLRKDRDERYQVVKDLSLDLKSLRHDLQAQADLERSVTPAFRGEAQAARSVGPEATATASGATRTAELGPGHATSSAEYLIGEIQRHRRGAAIALSGFVISLAFVGFVLYKVVTWNKESVPLNLKISRLTTSGKAAEAAISRDGNYVAWTVDDNGKRSLWIRQVANENSLQLVPPSEKQYWRPTFSLDGTRVYYSAGLPPDLNLYEISVLGGTPRKIMPMWYCAGLFALSPDGKQIAFNKQDSTESSLMIADLDGSNVQKLTSRKFPVFITFLSWAPNGKAIAFVPPVVWGTGFDLFEVRVEEKTERKLTSQGWSLINDIAWQSDGSALLISATAQSSPFFQIWRVSYPSGEARQLISDLNNYGGLSVAADSKSFVTVQNNEVSNIWVSSLADPGKAKQITFGAGRHQDPTWQPDGNIVYASDASGHADIWTLQGDGAGQRQLTNNLGKSYGAIATPDGKYIVFHSDRTGEWNLWRANSDGSNLKPLVKGEWASSSPDGRSLVYVFEGRLWRIPIEGGDSIPITEDKTFSSAPTVSPKGDFIACEYSRLENSSWRVAIIPFDDGKPVKEFEFSLSGIVGPAYRWTPDGQALVFSSTTNGVSNLWLQRLDGSRPKQLTDFKSDLILSFDVSRDGKLVTSRGTITSDVVLIKDFTYKP